MDDIIVVNELSKTYGKDTIAVDKVSFQVRRGEVFGFLGPNGAGKSTTIKILTTLIGKTSGEAFIDGLDIQKDSSEVRRIIGYASQAVGVDNDLTGRENLLLQCKFHHMPKDKAEDKVDSLLATVDLVADADRKLSTFSGGMRKRLDLATALVSDPKVLFLDEPTTGLDPKSRNAIWDYIRRLKGQGTTVFLTTQYMEEADQLADRLCIIDEGRIVAEGTPEELKAQIGSDTIRLCLKDDDPQVHARAREILKGLPGVKGVMECEVGITCTKCSLLMVEKGSETVPQVVRALDTAKVDISQLTLATPTLDDVFLKMTGKQLKVAEGKDANKSGRRRRRGSR
jgi:ABC-2 type transport system ATP-binding protein